MPQMAPMFWLTLFIMFNLMLLLMTNLIYFSSMKTPKAAKMNNSMSVMNWKW